jgi:hypothetical protein
LQRYRCRPTHTSSGRDGFSEAVSRETFEQEFALRRKLFLCEQGYTYRIIDG